MTQRLCDRSFFAYYYIPINRQIGTNGELFALAAFPCGSFGAQKCACGVVLTVPRPRAEDGSIEQGATDSVQSLVFYSHKPKLISRYRINPGQMRD
jgi:hypothetical protein